MTLGGFVCLLGMTLSSHPAPDGIDGMVLDWIDHHRLAWVTSAMAALTIAFGPIWVTGWTALAAAVLFTVDRTVVRPATVVLGVALAGAGWEIAKVTVARPRPPAGQQLSAIETGLSYPSGHVTGTTALVMTLAVVVTAQVRAPWVRRVVIAVATAVATLSAITRLYLGMHWASDVVAGMALGVAVATLAPPVVKNSLRQLEPRLPAGLRNRVR